MRVRFRKSITTMHVCGEGLALLKLQQSYVMVSVVSAPEVYFAPFGSKSKSLFRMCAVPPRKILERRKVWQSHAMCCLASFAPARRREAYKYRSWSVKCVFYHPYSFLGFQKSKKIVLWSLPARILRTKQKTLVYHGVDEPKTKQSSLMSGVSLPSRKYDKENHHVAFPHLRSPKRLSSTTCHPSDLWTRSFHQK